jgi:fumarylpyruvate hydrolase
MTTTKTPDSLTQWAVPATPPTSVPVAGTSLSFPVRRIYCVGRNYLDHIREMGADEREPPFFFQKPTDAIVHSGASIPFPTITSDFQYEVELVLAIGLEGANVAIGDAERHIYGFAIGVDLTRRDVQIAARKSGRPWEIGKSFDHSAPCGDLIRLADKPLPTNGLIELKVNDQVKQSADLDQMIWKSDEIVSKLSEHYRLMPGDLIYTGTPAGIGPLAPGDRVDATVAGLSSLTFSIKK